MYIARSYDAEQTNRSSSGLWGAGFPPDEPSVAHWRQCTSLYTAPYVGSLERKFAILLT
ncbi:hypothetical protein [Desulfosporosinus sp.]|uniref:hypothetical protein n=1 Tax=Desulfosporosinus sp. TaxID=157907 RepID=UPI00260F82BD|nr:hypothetical protein [Desulfosporosinus sp.]